MTDCQLHILQLIIAVLFQCLTSAKGTTCSTCTAEIHGPYLEDQTRELNFVEMVRATDSNPAVIVCSYVCCERGYNFELKIDILDPCEQPQSLRRERIQGSQVYQDDMYDFRVVPIINSSSTCDQENSEIRKYQIHVGSSDVPTLIAKCFVEHLPNLPSTENSTECSGSSTLAIIPGYSSPESSTCNSPSTNIVSPSPTLEPTSVLGHVGELLSRNNTNDCTNLHKIYASILAVTVTVFIAVVTVVILLAMIFNCHLMCTQKLKPDPQLCTYACNKTDDEVERTLVKKERTITEAWVKDSS